MKETINKTRSYIIKHKVISVIVIIAFLGGGYWGYKKFTSTAGNIRYITAKVKTGTIVSSVSGSGQVSSLNQVDIKAKVSGDVVYLGAQNGQSVRVGTLIAEIDAGDAQKTVRDAEISLKSAQLSLEKLKLQNSDENMNADLAKAYDDGFTVVSDTFLDLPSTVTGLDNILNQNNLSDNAARMSGNTAQDYRNQAETAYYKAKNAFEKNRNDFRVLDSSSVKSEIETIINETYDTTKLLSDAIKSIKNFSDYLVEDTGRASDFTSAQSTLSGYTSTMGGHLDSLLSIKTSIKNYKDAFLSGDLDIKSSTLTVKQRENTLQDMKDKLADYFIRAPFKGTITKINIKKSDSISAGNVVTTLITKNQLAEISLNEVDVAKIKIGQKATLTFDAIPDLTISGVVVDIDAVGTVSQGVVTYIVKISFDTQDDKVKPGMSVSTAIITDAKQDVLIVPNSAVRSQTGTNYVEMFDVSIPSPTEGLIGSISKVTPNKIPVEIGLTNDLESEIISGIQKGDEIIIRTILPTTTTATPSIFGGSTGNRGTTGGAVRIQTR